MNILLLSCSNGRGGAFAASYRLHEGLRVLGADSRMLVQLKVGDEVSVKGPTYKWGRGLTFLCSKLDSLPLWFYRNREKALFSPAVLPDNLNGKVASLKPDIIHLHWVASGFMRLETLGKFRRPIVWTLHDMWPFTGGCHYDDGCGRYVESCGLCPILKSKKESDLSRRVWNRKKKAWRDVDITIVTPSRWLAGCARKSSLFKDRRIEVIPNGLDTDLYKPVDRAFARERFGLPVDKKLILFGAMNATGDKRKGYKLLVEALDKLGSEDFGLNTELVIFGASRPAVVQDFGFKTHYMGKLNDEAIIAMLYGAVDAFVAPSLQDNLPNTVVESLACGTPVVAFDIGGMPDMVEHKKNGYLAESFDTDDLARGIGWVLENPERTLSLGRAAREKAEKEYSVGVQARRYLNLYEEMTEHPG